MSDAPNNTGNAPAFDFGAAVKGLPPEHQQMAQAKSWDGLDKVFDSYRNLEKLAGAGPDKLIRVPEKDEDYEAVYNKLGRPEKPDGYGFDKPPEGFDPAKYHADGAKALAEFAHKNGLSTKQASALRSFALEYMAGGEASMKAANEAKLNEFDAALQQEFGAKFEETVNLAAAGMDWAGVDKDFRKLLADAGLINHPTLVKAFAKIGTGAAEDKLIGTGAAGFGNMTPAMARARLNALKADQAFFDRFMKGDQSARQEWDKLIGIVAAAGQAA